ncbi:hypothetical protein L7F22_014164 [Adiantum nelumboides]|nr:hypothetical protein [Adiantum nelumboides]
MRLRWSNSTIEQVPSFDNTEVYIFGAAAREAATFAAPATRVEDLAQVSTVWFSVGSSEEGKGGEGDAQTWLKSYEEELQKALPPIVLELDNLNQALVEEFVKEEDPERLWQEMKGMMQREDEPAGEWLKAFLCLRVELKKARSYEDDVDVAQRKDWKLFRMSQLGMTDSLPLNAGVRRLEHAGQRASMEVVDLMKNLSLNLLSNVGSQHGHGRQSNQPNNSGGQNSGKSWKNVPTCYNCGELGHINPQCDKPKRMGGDMYPLPTQLPNKSNDYGIEIEKDEAGPSKFTTEEKGKAKILNIVGLEKIVTFEDPVVMPAGKKREGQDNYNLKEDLTSNKADATFGKLDEYFKENDTTSDEESFASSNFNSDSDSTTTSEGARVDLVLIVDEKQQYKAMMVVMIEDVDEQHVIHSQIDEVNYEIACDVVSLQPNGGDGNDELEDTLVDGWEPLVPQFILQCMLAQLLWHRLQSSYGRVSSVKVAKLEEDMDQLRIVEMDNMVEKLGEFNRIKHQLEEHGSSVSNPVHKLPGKLAPSFESFKDNIYLWIPFPSFEEDLGLLHDKIISCKSSKANHSAYVSPNNSSSSSTRPPPTKDKPATKDSSQGQSKVECGFCDRPNHPEDICHLKQKASKAAKEEIKTKSTPQSNNNTRRNNDNEKESTTKVMPIDDKSALLHGDLKDEVIVDKPLSFEMDGALCMLMHYGDDLILMGSHDDLL